MQEKILQQFFANLIPGAKMSLILYDSHRNKIDLKLFSHFESTYSRRGNLFLHLDRISETI